MTNHTGQHSAIAAAGKGRGATLAAALALSCAAAPVAAQTPAGTPIVNTAALHSAEASGVSNTVTLIVAERLDCTLARGGDAGSIVLTNIGNGREAFALTATDAAGGARAIAVDSDGDGRFDAAHDRRLVDGQSPVLAPGEALHLLVLAGDDAAVAVMLVARAITGSGAPGTLLAGQGDGGGDAVVGPGGGMARLTITPAAGQSPGVDQPPANQPPADQPPADQPTVAPPPAAEPEPAQPAAAPPPVQPAAIVEPPTLTDAQSVLASDGSTIARRGAVVTYTLVARFVAATAAASLIDPVPAGTAYLPASLTLDGAAIGDDGRVGNGRVVVPLGAVEAGAVHRLMFKVVIQ